MMSKTERLYYNDPQLLEFDANVVNTINLGERYGVVLDRTAFYPTSGGQPNDVGLLNETSVVDVYEDEATETVVHVTTQPINNAVGVHGVIDPARRRDHMQQHSGQHVLSQAFVELFNWPTVSFHLGVAASTIDLPVESVSREQASKAEDLANRIVQENRPVAVQYVASENIADAGLRKPTERTGDVRIIDIAGFDKSACGGTHVRMTGEIGPILITRIERAKKQTRVEFLCGGRVVRYARDANRVLEAISQTISSPPLEAAAAVKSVWNDLQESRKHVQELESKLLDVEAAQFPVEHGVASAVFDNRGIDTVKLLAQKICVRPGIVALFVDKSDQIRIVFARSNDLTADVSTILKRTIERFGGRGGGKPNLAQGGGLAASDPSEIIVFAKTLLSAF